MGIRNWLGSKIVQLGKGFRTDDDAVVGAINVVSDDTSTIDECYIAYENNPIVHASVDIIAYFCITRYAIKSDNAKFDEELTKELTRIHFKSAALVGIIDLLVGEKCCFEVLRGRKSGKIKALKRIKPTSIEKVTEKKIKLKEFATPFSRKDFIYFEFPIKNFGPGIVKCVVSDVQALENIKKGFSSAVFRKGIPIPWAKLGDEQHPPSQTKITAIKTKIKDWEKLDSIVTPYWDEITTITPEIPAAPILGTINFLRKTVITGLGVPEVLLGWSSAATLAGTKYQILFFQNWVQNIREIYIKDAFGPLFNMIIKSIGYKPDTVEFNMPWDEIDVEDPLDKAKRYDILIKAGIYTADDVREWVMGNEVNVNSDEDEDTTEDDSDAS